MGILILSLNSDTRDQVTELKTSEEKSEFRFPGLSLKANKIKKWAIWALRSLFHLPKMKQPFRHCYLVCACAYKHVPATWATATAHGHPVPVPLIMLTNSSWKLTWVLDGDSNGGQGRCVLETSWGGCLAHNTPFLREDPYSQGPWPEITLIQAGLSTPP